MISVLGRNVVVVVKGREREKGRLGDGVSFCGLGCRGGRRRESIFDFRVRLRVFLFLVQKKREIGLGRRREGKNEEKREDNVMYNITP